MWKENSRSEVLANWQYEPDLWRDFLEYESGIYKGSVRAAKHFFFISPIIMLLLFILVLKISSLVSDEWNSTMLALKICFGCGVVFFIFVGAFLWQKRHNNWNLLNQESGEALISLDGVNINGVNFVWTSETLGLHLKNIERKTITVNSGKNFEILVFSLEHIIPTGRGRPYREPIECRIPIPFGKEAEAENCLNRLHSQLSIEN